MNHNPYSPPRAEVVAADEEGPVRPRNVTIAVWLLGFAALLGVLASGYHTLSTSTGIDIVALALTYLTGAAVAFFVVWGVSNGWRWARILVSAVLLLQVKPAFTALSDGVEWFDGLVLVATLVPSAVATILLFTPSANAWFRRPRE